MWTSNIFSHPLEFFSIRKIEFLSSSGWGKKELTLPICETTNNMWNSSENLSHSLLLQDIKYTGKMHNFFPSLVSMLQLFEVSSLVVGREANQAQFLERMLWQHTLTLKLLDDKGWNLLKEWLLAHFLPCASKEQNVRSVTWTNNHGFS